MKTTDPLNHNLLAVVAKTETRAREVAACFAEAGDMVEAVWYADPHSLLERSPRPDFGAVILFTDHDEAAAHQAELEIRGAFGDTPLYRVA